MAGKAPFKAEHYKTNNSLYYLVHSAFTQNNKVLLPLMHSAMRLDYAFLSIRAHRYQGTSDFIYMQSPNHWLYECQVCMYMITYTVTHSYHTHICYILNTLNEQCDTTESPHLPKQGKHVETHIYVPWYTLVYTRVLHTAGCTTQEAPSIMPWYSNKHKKY